MPAFADIELHREGVGLVPVAGPDTAIYVPALPGGIPPLRSCTCAAAKRRTCAHLRALGAAVAEMERTRVRQGWEASFAATVWYRLARLLHEGNPRGCAEVRARRLPAGAGLQVVAAASADGEELACYLDGSAAEARFAARIGQGEAVAGKGPAPFDRAGLLDRLALFQLTPAERQMAKHGFKTQRQTWEESLWYRLAYHCVREALPDEKSGGESPDPPASGTARGTSRRRAASADGQSGPRGGAAGAAAALPSGGQGSFHPAIESGSGRFTLTWHLGGAPVVRVTVPRGQVEGVLRLLAASFPDQADLALSPLPLRSILHVGAETSFDRPEVEVRPLIQAIQRNGEERYFAADDKFRYGNLVYLPELGILAALERPGKERKFRAPAHLKLSRGEVPAFLDACGDAVESGHVVLGGQLAGRRVWKSFDGITVGGAGAAVEAGGAAGPAGAARAAGAADAAAGTGVAGGEALERSWRWLDVRYGFGNQSVTLADLLQARRDERPYLETSFGWIDLGAPAFAHLGRLLGRRRKRAGAGAAPGVDASGAGGAGTPAVGDEAGAGGGGKAPSAPAEDGAHGEQTARGRGLAPGGSTPPVDGTVPAKVTPLVQGTSPGEDSLADEDGSGAAGFAGMPLLELLRIQAASGLPLQAVGDDARRLERLFELRPAAPIGQPAGLRSTLRPYQANGADWLRFLYENGLAGLLCDDMGLGKTHQVMALMVSLVERGEAAAPFLVVCPTSVASHWRNRLGEHAPGLRVLVYHGSQRGLPESLAAGDVVITTYGLLRRDEEHLGRHRFALAVFDEAQHLKNPATQAHRAALRLDAEVRLILTGTPIENSLSDLKALFDLVLPGYLGSDREFEEHFLRGARGARRAAPDGHLDLFADTGEGAAAGGPRVAGIGAPTPATGAATAAASAASPATGMPGQATGAAGQAGAMGQAAGVATSATGAASTAGAAPGELRRLIAPFVLRRLKSAVLAEMPEKIEDVRTCALSADQVKLYRAAIAGRGTDLARELEEASGPVPYIHIFALLNLLKQICDHPALAAGRLDEADQHSSGKWDLYREVIEECLGSGLKVVVFSQYLGMLRLMARHLDGLGTEHVILTGGSGSTARRGALVDRFNNDPACRVFLGSLKAGGAGIDLVGGSVVIHYDRWWNAAREDQATDRVHRIGQRRAVQVIKLITEGTLEEKIAAIIERKRQTLSEIIPGDDPGLAKLFTRDQLLELLRWQQ